MKIFGENLKELRIEKGLTQKALATALGVTIPTLSHWECGYQEPSYSDLIKICRFFGVSADYMLGLSKNKTHPWPISVLDAFIIYIQYQ